MLDVLDLQHLDGTVHILQGQGDHRGGHPLPRDLHLSLIHISTDSRRGQGTFQAVRRAMKILKRKKLPFGVSCCYTRANTDVIGSEEYFVQP